MDGAAAKATKRAAAASLESPDLDISMKFLPYSYWIRRIWPAEGSPKSKKGK
jgi:hypothetical protein